MRSTGMARINYSITYLFLSQLDNNNLPSKDICTLKPNRDPLLYYWRILQLFAHIQKAESSGEHHYKFLADKEFLDRFPEDSNGILDTYP
jgi:hypothetical protein